MGRAMIPREFTHFCVCEKRVILQKSKTEKKKKDKCFKEAQGGRSMVFTVFPKIPGDGLWESSQPCYERSQGKSFQGHMKNQT